QLQDREGGVVVPVRRLLGSVGGAADGAAQVALVGSLVLLLGADAVQGNDEEQAPQLLAGGNVVVALAHPPAEPPKNRLDEVLRLDATLDLGRAAGAHQGQQALSVAEVQLGGGVLTAAAQLAQQGAVGRRPRRVLGGRLLPRVHYHSPYLDGN